MKKAILLLHGWLSDLEDFSPIRPYLEVAYDHIEQITYPGHGPGEDYHDFTAEASLILVEQTFERLQEEYGVIDVIGFSMGGALATYLANKYQFRKLVLLAPANRYFNLYLPFSKTKYLLKSLYAIQIAYLKKNQQQKEELRERIKAIIRDDWESLKFVKNKYMKSYLRHAYLEFRSLIELIKSEVKEIKNPCFIAWGMLDQLIPKEGIRELFEICTNENKILKIYEDLSHLLLLSADSSELVVDIVKFLED